MVYLYNSSKCRYVGFIPTMMLGILMMETNITLGGPHLYEGFAYFMAAEIGSLHLIIVDEFIYASIMAVFHIFIIANLTLRMPELNDVAIPGIMLPLVYLFLVAYVTSNHNKREFLLKEAQKVEYNKLYNLLTSFPERIVLSRQTCKLNDLLSFYRWNSRVSLYQRSSIPKPCDFKRKQN